MNLLTYYELTRAQPALQLLHKFGGIKTPYTDTIVTQTEEQINFFNGEDVGR